MEHQETFRVRSSDGLSLAVQGWGPRTRQVVLFLHGGGQTGWAWEATARRLAAAGHWCLAPDLRGHGSSGWAPEDAYSIDHFAQDVRTLVDSLCDEPPVVVGASLGGISALIAEADSKQSHFESLVLVDITPRWERKGVERILAFLTAHPDGFESLAQAAEAVRDYLPHRARRVRPDGLRKNLRRAENGRWVWHWDPSMLHEAHRTTDEWQPRLQQAATRLAIPILLISGGLSDVVSDRTVSEFQQLVPHAEHVRIDDAHHMVAGDSNDAFTDTILDFIAGRSARKSA